MGDGALISDWMTKEEISVHLKIGDLLEFRRTRNLAGRERSVYAHWAVYIGQEEDFHRVVHISTDDGDFAGGEGAAKVVDSLSSGSVAQVRRDTLNAVALNDMLRVNNSMDRTARPFGQDEIVERATRLMGTGNYHVVFNNCEHFATWARNGKKSSMQAVAASSLVVTAAASCVASPVVAVGAGLIYGLLAPKVSDMYNKN